MDVEALKENVREDEEVTAPWTQASSNGRKWPKVEERSQSIEGNNSGRLVHLRWG